MLVNKVFKHGPWLAGGLLLAIQKSRIQDSSELNMEYKHVDSLVIQDLPGQSFQENCNNYSKTTFPLSSFFFISFWLSIHMT